ADLPLADEAEEVELDEAPAEPPVLPVRAADTAEVLVERLDLHRAVLVGELGVDEAPDRLDELVVSGVELPIVVLLDDHQRRAEVLDGADVLVRLGALRDVAPDDAVDDLDGVVTPERRRAVEGDLGGAVGRREDAADRRGEDPGQAAGDREVEGGMPRG